MQGWIDQETGEVELNLSADFNFSAARFYKVWKWLCKLSKVPLLNCRKLGKEARC